MTIAFPYYGDDALDNPSEPESVYVSRLPNTFGDAGDVITLRWSEMTVAEREEWRAIGELNIAERWEWARGVRGMASIRAGH